MSVLNVWSNVSRGFIWLRYALSTRNFRPEEFKVILEVPHKSALFEIEAQLRNDKAFDNLVAEQPTQILSGTWVGIPYEIRVRDATREK